MSSPLSFEPAVPVAPLRAVEDMGLQDLERIRLILRGGSVIEWRRMHFHSRDEVDAYLRLCGVDPDSETDRAWVRTVMADAVAYLRQTFDFKVPEEVASPAEVHDLFLFASGLKEPRKLRRIACVVLKMMHVIQHVEGRDLLYRLPASEAEVQSMMTEKVMRVAEEAWRRGLPIQSFESSIKTRESIYTKLLAKKDSVAATVYDKTRFRLVTRARADIVPVLHFLTQRLFPFHLVVPNQTQNTLVTFKSLMQDYPHFRDYAKSLHLDVDYEQREAQEGNTFSGESYRVLNFIADIPLRMDAFLPSPAEDARARKNRIAFGLVEFQILDERTARHNEEGENSHEQYKARQRVQVLRRLARGLVVPKRRVEE
jgi:uncharacterized protein (TIGR04552 family)